MPLNGPGSRYLGLNKSYNGMSLLDNKQFYIKSGISINEIEITTQIGIKKAIDKS